MTFSAERSLRYLFIVPDTESISTEITDTLKDQARSAWGNTDLIPKKIRKVVKTHKKAVFEERESLFKARNEIALVCFGMANAVRRKSTAQRYRYLGLGFRFLALDNSQN